MIPRNLLLSTVCLVLLAASAAQATVPAPEVSSGIAAQPAVEMVDLLDCPAETLLAKAEKCLCLDVWDPVCGVDGRTYSNSCYAGCAGVAVAYHDACSSLTLASRCICPDVYAPVCGVDGRTYSNSCRASCAGVAVAYQGACGSNM